MTFARFALALTLASFIFVSHAHADADVERSASTSSSDFGWLHFAPQVKTVFPTFLGGGAEFILWKHLEIGAQYGLTPSSYSHVIADAAAQFSKNDSYKPVINAAFQDNHIVRANAQYDFSGPRGWHLGVAGNWMHANGDASVNDVLAAASTSTDFTALKAALAAEGKSSVNMKTDLVMGEAYAGYSWNLWQHLRFTFDIGVLKVYNANVKLNGGTTYEQTQSGKQTVNNAQSDIEAIVKKYGISPTGSFALDYWF